MAKFSERGYQSLKVRLKEFISNLSEYKKSIEEMRKTAFKLDKQQKTDAFFANIFIMEFAQYTTLLTLLRDLEAKLDQYKGEADKIRPESEERITGQVSVIPAVIYTAKAYGDYGATFVSENVKEQTGYMPEDFVKDSKFWAQHLHPDDKKHVFAKLPSLVEKGHWVMQYRFKHKDQSYRFMFEEAQMVYDREGKPKEIVGYWTDISGLRQIEEALRESEGRYRSFVENFPGIAYQGNMKFVPIFFHGRVVEITGYTEQEFKDGTPRWDHIVHPDDVKRISEAQKKIISIPNFADEYEYRIIHKNGEIRWVRENIRNVCDSSGKPINVHGVIMDITGRKQAEKTKRDSEERLKILFEEAPDAYFLLDLEGEFLDCNKAAERLTGYTRKEIIGKSFAELRLLPPEQIPMAFEGMSEAFENKITGLDEYTLSRRDRTQAVVEIKAHSINFEDKTLILGIVRDITGRKLSEKELIIRDQLIESSITAVSISDLKGSLTYINKAFLKMWGYDNEGQVLGKSAGDFWGDRKKVSAAMGILEQKGSWEGKLVARKKDGRAFEVHISAKVAKTKEGQPLGVTASLIDQGIWEVLAISPTANF